MPDGMTGEPSNSSARGASSPRRTTATVWHVPRSIARRWVGVGPTRAHLQRLPDATAAVRHFRSADWGRQEPDNQGGNSMRAVVFGEYGDRSVLRVQDRPDPKPGPGEALVLVEASGVN